MVIKYVAEAAVNVAAMGSSPEDFEKTMIIRPSAMKPVAPVREVAASMQSINVQMPIHNLYRGQPLWLRRRLQSPAIVGRLQVLNGSGIGKELVLNKALTTLGKPGVQAAVITKRPQGYFITHVEGQIHPLVNEKSVGACLSAE